MDPLDDRARIKAVFPPKDDGSLVHFHKIFLDSFFQFVF